MKSITAIREADNKRLANEGKPYRYDCAGYTRCEGCGAYWHEKHRCGVSDYYVDKPMRMPNQPPSKALPLIQRLRAYIAVEGQEGLAVRDALRREAADEIERLNARVTALQKDLIDFEKEAREACREAAAEARWSERQGEDYGSY